METVIQIVFKNESGAFAAQKALLRAANDFIIELRENYVIKKNVDGNADIRSRESESTGLGILGGSAVGGLLGMLGGPVGFGLGLIGGMVTGGIADVARGEDIEDYLHQLAKKLSPDETMLVALLWEYSTTATDELLKPFGGMLTRIDVDAELYKAEKAELDAIDKEIAEEEAAWAVARAENKVEREAKLKALKQKREDTKQRFKDNLEKRKNGFNTWVDSQKKKIEEWQKSIEEKLDAAKKENLQNRINKHTEELKELKERYDAI